MKTVLFNIITVLTLAISFTSCEGFDRRVQEDHRKSAERYDISLANNGLMAVRVEYQGGIKDAAFVAPLGTQVGDNLKDKNGRSVKVIRIVSGNRN
ncbi:hypothetical protein ACFSQ3_01010 [Sphingobacterium corticis]|uniref:Uncharacterized protein n=1 Tax=Sphingobacterium corticis TaxID=1812823 RepID=A0ABW5NFR7_9SPHI